MKTAYFRYSDELGYWLPADSEAVAATALISKRFLRTHADLQACRSYGYIPIDVVTGVELGRVDVTA